MEAAPAETAASAPAVNAAASAPPVTATAPDLALPTTALSPDLQPAPAPCAGAGQPRVQPVEAGRTGLHVDHVSQ